MAPFFLSVQSSLVFCLMELFIFLFFFWGEGAPRLESLFPPICGNLVIKPHWSSRSFSLKTPRPFIRSPDWETWCGVPNLHRSGRTSLVLLSSSLWVTHLAGMGFDFCCDCAPPTVLLHLLFGLWACDIFFWWFPSFFWSWLFNNWLWFWWCPRRRWAPIFLLHHLEPEAFFLFFLIN